MNIRNKKSITSLLLGGTLLRSLFLCLMIFSLLLLTPAGVHASSLSRPLHIPDFVGNIFPAGGSSISLTAGNTFTVYVEVYKDGVTGASGQGANIACTLHWAPVAAFGDIWGSFTDTPMTYNGDINNNDLYMATITPAAGLYELTASCMELSDLSAVFQSAGNIRLTVNAALPSVSTGAATAVTTSDATLNGEVNANGDSTSVVFEYGLSSSYGTTVTAYESPVNEPTTTPVSYTLTGLSPNTTYHYRAVATNSAGTIYGAATTFTTPCANAITVTSSDDSGPGTLRQAIAGVCSGGTITFDNDMTITLSSELEINKDLTITGAGHSVTVSGNHTGRVFYVNPGVTDTLDRLTIANGSAGGGGGINNLGTLTVTNSTLSGNSAYEGGGIHNRGTLTLTNSTLSGNSAQQGGGIINYNTMTMSHCTLSGNQAGSMSGGGIMLVDGSNLTYTNSIIANNIGGDFRSASITIFSDFTNLVEDGDAYTGVHFSGDPLLAPLGDYGGPTQTFALLPGSPAINAGSTSTGLDQRGVSCGGLCDIGAFESQGFSLSVTSGEPQTTWVNEAFADPLIVSISAIDPLEPVDGGLVSYSVPGSGASASLTGSPATISGGTASVSAIANGTSGPYYVSAAATGATSDAIFTLTNQPPPTLTTQAADNVTATSATLNATANASEISTTVSFEYGLNTSYGTSVEANPNLVSGSADTPVSANISGLAPNTTYHYRATGTNTAGTIHGDDATFTTSCLPNITVTSEDDSGPGTLRQAIADVCPGGTITFDNDMTITLSSELVISASTNNLTITGAGHSVTVSGNHVTRVFNVIAQNITFDTLTIADGNVSDMGGGILHADGSRLTVTNSTFSGNRASNGEGGAIYNTGISSLTITNSTFSGNSAYGNGGAIYNISGPQTVTNSTFSGNSSVSGTGGGIFSMHGPLTVTNSTFSVNSAALGGGIYCPELTVNNSIFSGNSAANGGGIYINNTFATLIVTNSTFSGNSTNSGGGIYNNGGNLTVTNSTFFGNRAGSGGGNFYNNSGTATIKNTLFAISTGENCHGAISDGGGNLQFGGTTANSCGTSIPTADPLLGELGNYGGTTQTFPLLPGSPAIDAGLSATCAAAPVNSLDQRGVARPAACDIGAFESQGFSLSVTSGEPQTTWVNEAFADPLIVSISAIDPLEPVDGGLVSFSAPGSGASASLTGSPATISGGAASVTATANGTSGQYSVSAAATGATPDAVFALTNQTPPTLSTLAAGSVTATSATLNATANANGIDTTISFEYGLDTLYGTSVNAVPNLVSGSTATPVSAAISGLAPNSTYHFRAAGINTAGTIHGGDATFTTPCSSAITVTSGDDSGPGTLRQAIADVCSGGTITFDNDRTITLASELEINKDLTITGAGHSVTVSGNHTSRVFDVNPGVTDTLDRLTITNGSAGGGGGINNLGTLTLTNSTLSGNSAYEGGGIHNRGTLTLTNSTLSGNSAYEGGGIINYNTMTMSHCTLSGNQAGSMSGGGIMLVNGSKLTYTNSIIANNIGGDFRSASATIFSNFNNVVEDGDASVGHEHKVDPLLAPLGNYGGPTQTFALLPGSPAIDGVTSECIDTGFDQRGVARPAACDIGAFESQGFSLSVDSGNHQTANLNSPFGNPLVVGVTANASMEPVDGGLVSFAAPGSGASASLTGSPATISGGAVSVSATANGTSGPYSVSAAANGAAAGVNFSLNNVTFPGLSISDASVIEGDSATSTLTFTISLSTPAPTGGVTFDIATADGSATTADGDYSATSLTGQSIPAGSSSYTFEVAVNGDTTPEADETFLVNITNIINATLTDGQSTGTITNDDILPTVITNPASGVTSSSATLNGTVNAEGNSTSVSFEYGPTTTYGTSINANPSPVSGAADTAVLATLNGLAPNTLFHYRVLGTSSKGTSLGDDQTFTTLDFSIVTTIHNGSVHTPIDAANLNDSLHAAVSITGSGPVASGSVDFIAYTNPYCGGSGTPAGSLTLDSSGTADPSTSVLLTIEGLSFRAHYNGDTNYPAADGLCTPISTSTYPTVLALSANTNPKDGDILTASPANLIVQFNRDVLHGDSSDADSADNPDNYLLVGAGSNGKFDTTACGGTLGGLQQDDTPVAINAITYDPGTYTAAISYNGGTPLSEGHYLLFICGTTSISDPDRELYLNNELDDSRVQFDIQIPDPVTQTVKVLPATGFAPNQWTFLPFQPVDKRYTAQGMELEIPSLGVKQAIVGVPGPEWNVSWLGNQIGYLQGTAFPTWNGNSVLAAHATNTLGKAGPFASLGKLAWGKQIIIHAWGQSYIYEVRSVNLWTSPNATDALSQHEELPWLTLITCHGYDEKTNTYRWRTVVRAVLVDVE